MVKRKNHIEKNKIMKTGQLRNLIRETIKEISEDDAMKKSALGMAMYGKKSKMERARYKDGGQPLPMEEDIDAKDGTEFKIKLKHLLQKHATNLKKGKADTEFRLTLKHLLDKHVSKGGEEKDD